jgi:hypothetical protein
LLDAEPLMPVSETGDAVFDFMPVDVAPGAVMFDMPVLESMPGLEIWPAAFVVLVIDGGAADVAVLVAPLTAPPICAKAEVENATAPHSSAVRMMFLVISFPRLWNLRAWARAYQRNDGTRGAVPDFVKWFPGNLATQGGRQSKSAGLAVHLR